MYQNIFEFLAQILNFIIKNCLNDLMFLEERLCNEEKNKPKENQNCLNVPEVFTLNENLLFAMYENIKIIDGDVRYPGIHLVSDNILSKDLLSYVGSMSII